MDHRFSSDEVARLLSLASTLADRHRCSTGEAISLIEKSLAKDRPPVRPLSLGRFAARVRCLRARRNQFLGMDLLRDPAWDMLLDLVSARENRQELSVTMLCLESSVPMTTALRQIERLEQLNLITRRPHPDDKRQMLVSLNTETAPRIEKLVAMFRDSLTPP